MRTLVRYKNTFKEIIIDDSDLELFICHRWSVSKKGYLRTKIAGKVIYLHKLLCSLTEKVDHKDGNTLNNSRNNLRCCTQSQNLANSKIYPTNKSGYKGVSKRGNKWRAVIMKDKRSIHLGYFASVIEAAQAYNKEAVKIFGEFAKINKIL
jgi:hypothetical protein